MCIRDRGNTVDANGIPTIVGVSGQTVGTSQDRAQQDAACCTNLTPTLSATSKSNVCPATTVDVSTITASNVPSGFISVSYTHLDVYKRQFWTPITIRMVFMTR